MEQRMHDLFRSIDSSDANAFASFLTEDVVLQFGNAEPIQGRDLVRDVIAGFFDSIHGLKHQLHAHWLQDDALICNGSVTYTRHDGSTLQVPFANILMRKGDLISKYMIYVDTSQLYSTVAA